MTMFARSVRPASPSWSRSQGTPSAEALLLPATGPSRRHATRVLERAGFRLERVSSFDAGQTLAEEDPTVCSLVPVPTKSDSPSEPDEWIEGRTLAELERKAFLDTLDATNGNRAETARRLGVSEKTVYNKLRTWGMLSQR